MSSTSSRSSTPTPGAPTPAKIAKRILRNKTYFTVAIVVAVLTWSVILSVRLPDAEQWKLPLEQYGHLYVRSIDVVVKVGAALSFFFLAARYALDFIESV